MMNTGPADPEDAAGVMAALSELERRVLTFERSWWRSPAHKEQEIRDAFGFDAVRYYQLLNETVERPEALAFDAVLVERLHKQRARRAELGSAGRTQPVPEPIPDAEGYDLRPDPLAVRTPADLVAALQHYREWAGKPSFRVMAARTRQKAAASTLCTALGSGEFTRLDVVVAVIAGCGGSEEDQRRFATAWRRIQLGQLAAGPAVGERALRVVPSAAEAG